MSESTETETAASGDRKAEIRAAWVRISTHTEGLRQITGELIEDGPSGQPRQSLAAHATGARRAIADLESIASQRWTRS
jgi:hypothetical protein